MDPTPLIAAGAEALDLDKGTDRQLNVHQRRVVSTRDVKGVAAPECLIATAITSASSLSPAATT